MILGKLDVFLCAVIIFNTIFYRPRGRGPWSQHWGRRGKRNLDAMQGPFSRPSRDVGETQRKFAFRVSARLWTQFQQPDKLSNCFSTQAWEQGGAQKNGASIWEGLASLLTRTWVRDRVDSVYSGIAFIRSSFVYNA